MANEHTPGEWQIYQSGGTPPTYRIECDNYIIAHMNSLPASLDRTKADAKLIAAAPETKKQRDQLLVACKECLHLLDRWNDFGTDPESAKAHLKAVIESTERAQ